MTPEAYLKAWTQVVCTFHHPWSLVKGSQTEFALNDQCSKQGGLIKRSLQGVVYPVKSAMEFAKDALGWRYASVACILSCLRWHVLWRHAAAPSRGQFVRASHFCPQRCSCWRSPWSLWGRRHCGHAFTWVCPVLRPSKTSHSRSSPFWRQAHVLPSSCLAGCHPPTKESKAL